MSSLGKRLIAAAKEAVAIARGERIPPCDECKFEQWLAERERRRSTFIKSYSLFRDRVRIDPAGKK
jgi:hypothetical protein